MASYDWSFGDGTSAQSAGATATHVYSSPGEYTVTLTVTDSAGCSTQVIYTGQTASCNGSSAATSSQTMAVPGSGSVQARALARVEAPALARGRAPGHRGVLR